MSKPKSIPWTNQHHIKIVRDCKRARDAGWNIGLPGRDRAREQRVLTRIMQENA